MENWITVWRPDQVWTLLIATEWITVTDTAQLMVFVHMSLEDCSTEEDFLTINPRGDGIFNEFKCLLMENNSPWRAGGYHSHLQ